MNENFTLLHALNRCNQIESKRKFNTPTKSGSVIYFIQAGEFIKIGISNRKAFNRRLASLQTGCPYKLTVLRVVDTLWPVADERRLHRLFSAYRVRSRNEWFKMSKQDLDDCMASVDSNYIG